MLFSDDHVCELVVRVTEDEARMLAAGLIPNVVRRALEEAAQHDLKQFDRDRHADLPLFAEA